jgi:beta-lactamase regulating signal transducer with metallopeptidase domain
VKTSIDIDREAAGEAAEILGTSAEHRRQLAEAILAGTLAVPTIEELAEWRAPKVPLGALGNERDPAA